ncbi:MarR family winged helix-turn-helix transcriptional regulator [Chitinophaga sp. XS-30]|uniref:MarR family winged helix-turn-helix transcriptional regulator n=1 Tax=Chitinophaga sp. XS-30 TaxID=2604421 RepID=UPI0011DC8E39|nr:MarR family winged helix-turn-helix transcriptional regulator [Chitinophaga sp. XS-30]QEH42399.1 winged helix-turn-helix transcriptional regulator [Chitinophaga sp. XS-30]
MKQAFINEIRAFNRFYTNIIGLLDRHILDSSYSLPEVRVLYELYHSPMLTASDIIALLDIDKGYLSRILKHFEKNKLITKAGSPTDKRAAMLQLTNKGKAVFETLNEASDKQVGTTFKDLTEKECQELVQKMKEIQLLINRKNLKK